MTQDHSGRPMLSSKNEDAAEGRRQKDPARLQRMERARREGPHFRAANLDRRRMTSQRHSRNSSRKSRRLRVFGWPSTRATMLQENRTWLGESRGRVSARFALRRVDSRQGSIGSAPGSWSPAAWCGDRAG